MKEIKELIVGNESFGFIDEMARIYTNVESFGAKGDGKTNDTIPIQNAINESSNIFIPDGTYLIDGLVIDKSINILGSKNTKFVANDIDNFSSLIKCVGTRMEDISIKNIKIEGSNKIIFGLFIQYFNDVMVENCEVRNCGNVGYSLGNTHSVDGILISKCQNSKIVDCLFENIERDGILGYPSTYLTVENCHFNNCGRFPSANTMSDGTIGGSETEGPLKSIYKNNYCLNCGCGGLDVETSSTLNPVELIIEGNTIINCGNNDWGYSWGISVGNNSFGKVSKNRVENLGLNSVDGATGENNGIVIGATKGDVIVSDNILKGTKGHGIYVESSTNDVVIVNNSVSGSLKDGIYISNNQHVTIANNIIKNNGMNGIRLNLASGSIITNNIIKNNSQNTANTYSAIKTELSFMLNINENTIGGTSQKYGIEIDNFSYVSNSNITSNIIMEIGTKWANFVGTHQTSGEVRNGVCEMKNSSIWEPIDGTWRIGDKVYIPEYGTNKFLGYVCTGAGTPGTWKKFGSLTE